MKINLTYIYIAISGFMVNPTLAMEKKEETQQEKAHKIHYITAKMNIGLLEKKAEEGDMNSALAVGDFYENIKDPNYKIDYPPCKKLLNDLGLLDDKGKVHNATREAFKQFVKF